MRKLFLLVANPTQMINAIEARHFYSNSFSQFQLVVFSDSLNYQKQVLSMADESWDKLVYHPKGSGKWNVFRSILAKRDFICLVLKNAQQGDALMIGNIHHYGCCSLADAWRDIGDLYAMDDGLGTVNWDIQLRGEKTWTPKTSKGWRGRLERWILGIPEIELSNLNFFSVYPLSHFNQSVTNNFGLISKSFVGKKYNDAVVYFLEQPLVELGILSQKDYDCAIGKIISHYQEEGLEFKIVTHRASHLKRKSHDVEYLSLDGPVEWEMRDWDVLPRKVATFYSSGAYHLSKMSQGDMIAEYWQILNDSKEIAIQPQLMKWLSVHAGRQMSILNVAI